MSNDKIEDKLLEIAKQKYENETEETKEKLKAKGITIEKALEMYSLPHFLDFYYIANYYDKGEVLELDETKEYYESLSEKKQLNYKYLKEAYEDLTTEEKTLVNKYYQLSYLADIYDEITDYNDALEVLCINIEDKLKDLRPVYNYTEEQVKEYFISEGFNPKKSELLQEDGYISNLKKLTDNINNEIIDHSKPYGFKDINEKTKEEEGLEYKYLLFCEEYLKRGKITETCKYLGIGRNTAYRWLEKEEVKKFIENRKTELENEAKERYNALYNKCLAELESSLDKHDLKLKAIDIFLKHYDNVRRKESNIEE